MHLQGVPSGAAKEGRIFRNEGCGFNTVALVLPALLDYQTKSSLRGYGIVWRLESDVYFCPDKEIQAIIRNLGFERGHISYSDSAIAF